MVRCQRNDVIAVRNQEWIGGDNKRSTGELGHVRECVVDLRRGSSALVIVLKSDVNSAISTS
jgi:hypothetical protein